jgi:phage shock protein E
MTAALTLVLLAGSGCAASDTADDAPQPQDAPSAASARTEIADPSTVRDAIEGGAELIDVRTPEEFAAGHLQGAVNIGLAAADFEQRVADLDMTANYVVYCASGNRAGTAIETMTNQGFDDLINGGGYEDLAAEGLRTN